MINILRYTEYLYILVAGFSIFRIISEWNSNGSVDYFFIFTAVVSIGMFLFRRNYRKKFEQRKRDNNKE
tara:strand:- start:55120 stop:55326 length:207 start_codon:yes stop_codon:yes gene_type:complete